MKAMQRSGALLATLVALSMVGITSARAAEPFVHEVITKATAGDQQQELELHFGKPVRQTEAKGIRDEYPSALSMQLRDTTSPGEPASAHLTRGTNTQWLGCEGSLKVQNSQSTWEIELICSKRWRIPWSWRIAPAVQRIGVVGATEAGLSWSRNGRPQPKNAPHTETLNYIFHGTMTGMLANESVHYWDVINFRHRLNGGGWAKLSMSGTVVVIH